MTVRNLDNDTTYSDHDKTLVTQIRDLLDVVMESITNARYENVSDLTAYDLESGDSLKGRLTNAWNLLADDVDDKLLELDQVVEAIETERDDLADRATVLEHVMSPSETAMELRHELRGRTMTDTPTDVLAWVDLALSELILADTPDTVDDATALILSAVRAVA